MDIQKYICKTQIDAQPLIDVKSMSYFYVTEICTSDLCPFFEVTNRRSIFKYMAVSQFLKSMSNYDTDVFLTPYQCIGHRSQNFGKDADLRIPLYRTVIWDTLLNGRRFESGRWSEPILYKTKDQLYISTDQIHIFVRPSNVSKEY